MREGTYFECEGCHGKVFLESSTRPYCEHCAAKVSSKAAQQEPVSAPETDEPTSTEKPKRQRSRSTK